MSPALGGFRVQRETAITVRPARGASTMVAAGDLAPGAEIQLAPPLDRFVPGTWKRVGDVRRRGALRRRRPGARRSTATRCGAWSRRPAAACRWHCCRTARSPVLIVPRDCSRRLASCSTASASMAGSVSGPPRGEAEPWLSVYATEFLLRARDGGRGDPRTGAEGCTEIHRRRRR